MNLRFLVAGLVSGCVSAALLQTLGDRLLYWAPGLVFGVGLGFAFMLAKGRGLEGMTLLRVAGMALLSVAAWGLAVFLAQWLITVETIPGATEHKGRFWYAGVVAGGAGGAILAGSAWLMGLAKFDSKQGIVMIVAGIVCGGLLHFWPLRIGESNFHIGPYILLIPWQAAIAVMLGRMRDAREKTAPA